MKKACETCPSRPAVDYNGDIALAFAERTTKRLWVVIIILIAALLITNAINAIKDGNASVIREFGVVESALTALGGKQQECCCSVLRAIDSVNYNGAINTAAINANTTAQTQKILDAIAGNRMADMQNQINQLQLAQAMSGVMKYPSTWAYNAGTFPPTTTAAG